MTALDRRSFLAMLAAAGAAMAARGAGAAAAPDALYDLSPAGNLRLLHLTDTHGQLLPLYFREPHMNMGMGEGAGRFPHLVGRPFLDRAGLGGDPRLVHAFTHLDFVEAAREFGKVGGYAHLKTLIDRLRAAFPGGAGNTLLLDGGDTWQGSASALLSSGMDMVSACNLLGVDAMTGHWEFTYGEASLRRNLEAFSGDFIAQNVLIREEALFDGEPVHDEATGHVFPPFTLRSAGGCTVAIIGQAFPYTPIANPARFMPHWQFGINEQALQELVHRLRGEKVDLVVLLSHNGMDVDLKLASRVTGIDVILGGHTHDAVPVAMDVANRAGRTLVTNAGCSGKFLGVLDLAVGSGAIRDYRYTLLPVFSNLLSPDPDMAALIQRLRSPHEQRLQRELAVTESLLYRRGNFSGTFDQVICDALREVHDTQIAFSPGFRWGTTILPGEAITWERLLDHTAISYPETYAREFTGAQIKTILEDVADNLFNPDPYYRQGGDMVRSSGLRYVLDPAANAGRRVSQLALPDGTAITPEGRYRVGGWAATGSVSDGPPVWEVVEQYLRDRRVVQLNAVENPVVRGIEGNPGAA